ncbi:MAG: hypothetical protein JWM80_3268 [Cyanobacteria bacterium RYN_339]|nr:hypothetical protein [Cyanobacteria bacterium RYN_339]
MSNNSPGSDSLNVNSTPAHAGTQPLNRGRGTRPLMDANVLRLELEQTLSKAGRLATSLENRMELLFHACQSIDLPVPGVYQMEFKHAVSPQGKKIISYLEKVLVVKPDLAKKVQVAIFRFQEANESHKEARNTLKTGLFDETILEQVKLKFFYLTNYYEEFKDDPLLAQMFPAPKGGTGTGPLKGGTGQMMPQEIRKYRQLREIAVRRAETILKLLAPGMDKAKQMLEMMEDKNAKGKSLFDIFNPAQRQDRLLAQRLKEDPKCTQIVRNAHALYMQMSDLTREVKRGGQYERLQEAIDLMGQMAGIWSTHHLLREFFPTLRKELFANPGTRPNTGQVAEPQASNAPPAQRARGTGRLDQP